MGPLRRLAEQQRRLGAVPRPVLGHAAADLAQRRRPDPDGRRRLAGRAVRADRPGPRPTWTRTGRSSTRSPSPLPGEEGTYRRVRQVIDAWYDSGSMPFAQWGAPHRNKAEFEAAYPAQFICEAIDQTRGWFYTLMAVGTLVFDQSSYENVLCLGHILAEDGRKMSKHLGNILEPIPLMDRHGADAVRWFMLAGGSPWSARRVGPRDAVRGRPQGPADLLEHRQLLHPLRRDQRLGPGGARPHPPRAERPLLDRWALAELASVTAGVTDGAGGLRHPDRRPADRRLRRRPVQLVRPPHRGAASGTATRRRWPRCTRCSTGSPG